jgi:hypothetical protein
VWCSRSSRTINPANCCLTITLKGAREHRDTLCRRVACGVGSPRARESRSLTCHKVVIPWRADAMCVEGVAVKLLSLE